MPAYDPGPGPSGGQTIPMPEKPMSTEAAKLMEWITGKGIVTRQQVLASRVLPGQQAYDRALAELTRHSLIVCTASGPMAGWTYSISSYDEGRAMA